MTSAPVVITGRSSLNGGVGYWKCPNTRLGVGVQPPKPLPFLDALVESPPTASTFQRVDSAAEGVAPETCLRRRPPSEGTKRYSDTAVTCWPAVSLSPYAIPEGSGR